MRLKKICCKYAWNDTTNFRRICKTINWKISSSEDIKIVFKIDEEVLKQFKLVYKEGEIKKGRNLLAFEVAKRNVAEFLKIRIG
jgi:hypothetical protein